MAACLHGVIESTKTQSCEKGAGFKFLCEKGCEINGSGKPAALMLLIMAVCIINI